MMKKILFILFFLVATISAFSQLPSVVEVGQDSFRIKRGEFVLRNSTKDVNGFLYNTGFGVTKFVRFEKLSDTSFIWDQDTMYASNVSVINTSGDTIVNVGDGHAIYKGKNGTQFEMKTLISDGSIVFIDYDDSLRIVVDSAVFATVSALNDTAAAIRSSIQTVTASRGLHMNGNDVRWGITPLDSAVDIDQVGNGITFHDGLFKHYKGNIVDFTSAYNVITNDENGFQAFGGDGSGENDYQIGTTAALGGIVSLQTFGAAGDARATLQGDVIELFAENGGLFFQNLIDSAQDYVLYTNPFTRKVTYALAGTTGSTADSVYTVNSGLSASTPTNFQLGAINNTASPLLHNTWINTDAYNLNIRGSSSTWPLSVQNISTGFAARFESVSSPAMQAVMNPATTNTLTSVVDLVRATTGTPANGIGAGQDYYIQTSLGGTTYAGTTGMVWGDVNHATRTSRYDLFTVNNALTSRKLSVAGSGRLTLDKYGVGAFTATPVWGLGVDANGNVVEYTPGTSTGTGSVTANNGLIANTPTNVQLGTNPLIQNTTIPTSTFSMTWSGAFSGNLFNVTNSNNTGSAINAIAGTSATGVQASGGLYGVYGQTTGGTGGRFVATTGMGLDVLSNVLAARISVDLANTNGMQDIAQFVRTTTGTAADGIGQIITLQSETSNGTVQTTNQFWSRWTTANTATRTSLFELYGTNNAVQGRLLAAAGNGQMTFDKYGTGTFTGTLAKVLGVTTAGQVIEVDAGGLSSGSARFGVSGEDDVASQTRDFDQAGNGITFHGGLFRHKHGDYDGGTTKYTYLNSDSATGFLVESGDVGRGASIQVHTDAYAQLQAASVSLGAFSQVVTSVDNGISIEDVQGRVYMPNLMDSAQAKALFIDPGTGKVTMGDAASGGATLSNAGSGDTLYTSGSIKSLIPGANITFTVGANTITINGASGTAEINTLSTTISTTGTLTVSTASILEYVLVKPASDLTGFKIGTVADDDYYFPATPVTATADFQEFVIIKHIPSSTAVQFSGITSSTQIKLVFKPLHE